MNDTPQVSRLVRTALFVSDLDRSSRFYRQGLGYHEVYSGGELTHKVAHALLGVPEDSAIRYEIVKAEGPNFGMIGMFEVKPSPPKVSRASGGVNIGEGCPGSPDHGHSRGPRPPGGPGRRDRMRAAAACRAGAPCPGAWR